MEVTEVHPSWCLSDSGAIERESKEHQSRRIIMNKNLLLYIVVGLQVSRQAAGAAVSYSIASYDCCYTCAYLLLHASCSIPVATPARLLRMPVATYQRHLATLSSS